MADKKTDELKNEAVKTANDAKDSVTKADFKTEAKKTSNFIFELFRDPISSIEGVVTDKKNTKFITAIIIFAVWLLFIFINSFQGIGALGWGYFWTQVFETFKSIFKNLLSPIIGVAALSLILFLYPKKGKTKITLTSIITLVIIVATPIVCCEVLDLLRYFRFLHPAKFLNTIGLIATLLSGVLSYFAFKSITGEDDDKKAIRNFMVIQGIYFIVYFVLSLNFIGIYLPIL